MHNFFWGGEDEEDEQSQPPQLPLFHQSDTVITVGQKEQEIYSESDDDSDDTDESDSEYDDSPVDKKSQEWINHIINVTCDVYDEPVEMIRRSFYAFARAYPDLDEINMGAFEYIRDPREYNHKAPQQGIFKCLFYNALTLTDFFKQEPAKALFGVPGVFLVNQQLDFIYGRIIECALLRNNDTLSKSAYEAFNTRKHLIRPCAKDHDQSEKSCPSEWVLYVNMSSPFYQFCSSMLKSRIPYVDFSLTTHYVESERLCFYLVLFLCGDLLDTQPLLPLSSIDIASSSDSIPSQNYTEINQWKKLPIWFIAIWYAANPVDM